MEGTERDPASCNASHVLKEFSQPNKLADKSINHCPALMDGPDEKPIRIRQDISDSYDGNLEEVPDAKSKVQIKSR